MAYTAVKLDDVKKAIAAVTAAQNKYTTAQNSTKTSQTAVTNTQKALDTAQAKLDQLRSAFDDQSYLAKNAGYTNALKAITNAEKARDAAQSRLDSATDKTRAALEKALDVANKSVETSYANLDKSRVAAEKAYLQGTIKPAETAFNTANKNFETAQNKYQGLTDSIQPLLDARNDAINNVSGYIDTIRGSLGDITKMADAKSVQTLLGQIQTAVNNTKLTDLIDPVKSMISEIDPLKMASIPTINIKGANPDAFSNIDPNTGLPVLDQGGLDSVLDRYKSNKINEQQYRDNWNKFGWNVKSDASTAMRGPAIVGLDRGTIQAGMSGGTSGIVRAGTNTAATDADFKKAATELGIDINQYYTTKETTGSYGVKSTQKVLDKQSLYNDIADKTKDIYLVANSITGGNEHAAILFKADGSGNLVPVTDQKGNVLSKNYTATRNVTGETWYGDLLPFAAISASFFLPGIGTALAEAIAPSVAPALTSLGVSQATAVSLAPTIASGLSSAAISGGLAAITGGDVLKSAISGGLTSVALSEASTIAKTALGGGEEGAARLKAIAQAGNMTQDQAAKIITNGLSTGITASIQGQDPLKAMEANVLSNITGTAAKNYVGQVLSDVKQVTSAQIAKAADTAGTITKVGTQALVTGQDLGTALTNAAPAIVGGLTKGAPVVEKGVQAQTTAALEPEQVGALQPSSKVDIPGTAIYKETADYIKPGTTIPPGYRLAASSEEDASIRYDTDQGQILRLVPVSEGPDYSTITGQAGAGALSSFGQGIPTPSDYKLATSLPSGVISTGPDVSTIQGQAGFGALSSMMNQPISSGYIPSSVSGLSAALAEKSLPPVEVIGKRLPPEDIPEEYISEEKSLPPVEVIGERLPPEKVIPSEQQQQIEQNLVSLGLPPVQAVVVAKNAVGKPASFLNNWYAILFDQAAKKYVPMGEQESNILMTPEQMQERGYPVTPQPAQPQFYRRGGLASIRR